MCNTTQYHAIPWVPRIRRTRWQDGDKTWCRHSVVGIGGVSKLEIRIRCARLGHTCWPTNRCIGCCYIIRCTHCSSAQSRHLTTIVWVIFLFFAFVIFIQYFICCCYTLVGSRFNIAMQYWGHYVSFLRQVELHSFVCFCYCYFT